MSTKKFISTLAMSIGKALTHCDCISGHIIDYMDKETGEITNSSLDITIHNDSKNYIKIIYHIKNLKVDNFAIFKETSSGVEAMDQFEYGSVYYRKAKSYEKLDHAEELFYCAGYDWPFNLVALEKYVRQSANVHIITIGVDYNG